MLEALPVAAFVAGVDGAIEHVSAGWTALTGYAASEALGFGYLRAVDVADIDRIGAMWSTRAASEAPVSREFRFHCSDGSRRWIRLDLQPIAGGASGLDCGWFGGLTDVDGYKRSMEELHESESMYRVLSGALPGVTWAASPAGDLTFVGDRRLDLHADSRDRALGDAWLASVHPDDRDRLVSVWTTCLATGDP